MFSTLLASLLLLCTGAQAETTEATLAQLSLDPNSFKGQVVQSEVSLQMVVAQKAMNFCKGKDKAFMVMPRLKAAEDGSVLPSMGAMGSVSYQVCVPVSEALALAELDLGHPLRVTGKVKAKRMMGILVGVVFHDASVEVLEGGGLGALTTPAADQTLQEP